MKKTITILLAAAMALSMVNVAFADEPVMSTWDGTNYTKNEVNNPSGTTGNEFDASATFAQTPGGTIDSTVVYCVDIAWTVSSAAFTNKKTNYKWDPDNLKYVAEVRKLEAAEPVNPNAEKTRVTITITNKSNARVQYNIVTAPAKLDPNDENSAIFVQTEDANEPDGGAAFTGRTNIIESAAPDVTENNLTGEPDGDAALLGGTAKVGRFSEYLTLKRDDNNEYIATVVQANIDKIPLAHYTITLSLPAV